MLTKAKTLVLAFTIAVLGLIGLATPAVASTAPVHLAAATAPQELPCKWQPRYAAALPVRSAASTSARVLGSVNRSWVVQGGPGCRSGYARFVNGGRYNYAGNVGTRWAGVNFLCRGKYLAGFVPAAALYRTNCPQTAC